MTSMNDLEREIEESRARLDQTIGQIQGRLSATSLVDEMLGTARRTPQLSEVYDRALDAVRRNPVPVLLIATGIGLLVNRIARDSDRRRVQIEADGVANLNGGATRSYDPDAPEARPIGDPVAQTKV